MKLKNGDPIFDGFAHRGFDERWDGWRNELPDEMNYPCVKQAKDTLDMFEELSAAKRRIWELEQELRLWKR